MKILGISAYYHDSAAALLVDGKCVAAAQEERFTRKKNDADFPSNAVQYCLREGNVQLDQIDAVVFYDKPFLKFERILQTVLETAPKGWGLFIQSMISWLKEKLFLKSALKKELKKLGGKKLKVGLYFSGHHQSHAASAFYASPFQEAAVLTVDGVGEWATATIAKGSGTQVTMLKQMDFPHSLGLFYASVTYFLGFKINEGEYKVMGLAPYAQRDSERVQAYFQKLSTMLTLHADGSLTLHPDYFSYTHAAQMIPIKKWEKILGISRRLETDELTHEHAALAMAVQMITEKTMLAMAGHAKSITGCNYLCMAGGVALNCVSNGLLRESGIFNDIFVQPAAGDAGGALGAALAFYYAQEGNMRQPEENFMQSCALGPRFDDSDIVLAIGEANLKADVFSEEVLVAKTAEALAGNKVVGWFQDRMEFGPRALGNRSILGNPLDINMQRTLNLKIKKRESFRPFAPVMMEEELSSYFEHAVPNAYMLFVHALKPSLHLTRPPHFYSLPLKEMLGYPGSVLPAITHVDYSARIQTVSPLQNEKLYALLQCFKKITGYGILINTSFNVKDEPIVCTPQDAIRCFLQTEMDILVLENYWIEK